MQYPRRLNASLAAWLDLAEQKTPKPADPACVQLLGGLQSPLTLSRIAPLQYADQRNDDNVLITGL